MCLDAVGAPVIIAALVVVAFDKDESQEKHALL
jgi:hypothetical protein